VSTVAFTELPWVRRERADANIRRAIWELRALAREDEAWVLQYRSLADAFEAAIALLDAIEDTEDSYSRVVGS
jgi:DNA-binding SARP family transcriptional activator